MYKKSNFRLYRKPQMLGSVTATSLCGCSNYALRAKLCKTDDADGALYTV